MSLASRSRLSFRLITLIALAWIALLQGCATTTPLPGIWLEEQTRGAIPAGRDWQMGPRGLQLTKDSEAFRGKPYNDPVGYCTVGYGHLIKKVRCDGTEPPEFRPRISEPLASDLLRVDMRIAEVPVMASIAADLDLTQTQVDALCDFVFNVGASNFRSSTLLQVINNREFHRVPGQFRRWVYANQQKLPGLERRRENEIALFMEGVSPTRGPVPADEDLSPIDIRSGEGAAQ